MTDLQKALDCNIDVWSSHTKLIKEGRNANIFVLSPTRFCGTYRLKRHKNKLDSVVRQMESDEWHRSTLFCFQGHKLLFSPIYQFTVVAFYLVPLIYAK